MLYCIYHGGPFNGWRVDIGVERDFVDQIVKTYLKGQREVTISGITYSIGTDILQVYEVSSNFDTSKSIKIFFNEVHSGNINNQLLSDLFKNVTDIFLRNGSYGDLKEDYFNIYINDGLKKPIITVLTKNEVLFFLDEWFLRKVKM